MTKNAAPSSIIDCLDAFPAASDFYEKYWNRAPFVVRGGVTKTTIDGLIDADTLAALSIEDDIKARLVTMDENGKRDFEHGPFDESRYDDIGDQNWSLLVQNVEQFHPQTATLLAAFPFAPRWLMDDIMVSYSAIGGTVGAHTDSYHVFLVQGIGKRAWKVGHAPFIEVENEAVEGGHKTIPADFEGTEFEVTTGDVIYIPPHFAHDGRTLDHAMTFSIGFLGPDISDLFIEYGHYLQERAANALPRYTGAGLNEQSAGFTLARDAITSIQNTMNDALQADDFSNWLGEFFTSPENGDIPPEDREPDTPLTSAALAQKLKKGAKLLRPDYIKICTINGDKTINLAAYGHMIEIDHSLQPIIDLICQSAPFGQTEIEPYGDPKNIAAFLVTLYNQNIIFFEDELAL
jgi:50S ribosomal protein L16 3-hydroxylase